MVASDTLAFVGKYVNPFGWTSALGDAASSYLGYPVELISSNTVGLLYGDAMVCYLAVMLFVVSLFIITLTDNLAMPAPMRTLLLKIHFAFVKALRCVVLIGLFFLGKTVGSAGTFADGLSSGRDMVVTIASLFVVQKMLEAISATVPGTTYYNDFKGTYTAPPTNGTGPVPFIKGDNWFMTFATVMREYLDQVTTTAIDAFVGISRQFGQDLKSRDVNGQTQGESDTDGTRGIRYLWQASNISFQQPPGTTTTLWSGLARNDQAVYLQGGSDTTSGTFNVLYSPFFLGVAIGLLK
jgi:hypothetical protein